MRRFVRFGEERLSTEPAFVDNRRRRHVADQPPHPDQGRFTSSNSYTSGFSFHPPCWRNSSIRLQSDAIALAVEVDADVLLVDDEAGRQEAVRRGPRVAGTLSVLDEAEQAGLVNFDEAVAELQKTTFRVSQAVLAEIKAKRSR